MQKYHTKVYNNRIQASKWQQLAIKTRNWDTAPRGIVWKARPRHGKRVHPLSFRMHDCIIACLCLSKTSNQSLVLSSFLLQKNSTCKQVKLRCIDALSFFHLLSLMTAISHVTSKTCHSDRDSYRITLNSPVVWSHWTHTFPSTESIDCLLAWKSSRWSQNSWVDIVVHWCFLFLHLYLGGGEQFLMLPQSLSCRLKSMDPHVPGTEFTESLLASRSSLSSQS